MQSSGTDGITRGVLRSTRHGRYGTAGSSRFARVFDDPNREDPSTDDLDHPSARRRVRVFDSTRTSSTSPMVRCWVMASRSGR
jgi:hypothetical protein